MEGVVMSGSQFWKGKRVLVTGHSGFKGAWLTLWLHELGAEVQGFSLGPVSNPSLFELADVKSKSHSVFGDIRDLPFLLEQVEQFKPEIILHLAAQALVRSSYRDPVTTYATNVMGTVNVFECARQVSSVQVVVNVTTDKCYENREWDWGYRENEPMGGHDPYSSSKGCSEIVTAAYRRSFFSGSSLKGIASARAGNVIGGGDWAEDRLIPDCIEALKRKEAIVIRNPKSFRPWQHVLEPLSGYLSLAERLWGDPSSYSQGWNFGPEFSDSKPVGWIADRMVQIWGEGTNWESPNTGEKPHEASALRLDSSLARARLKWSPRLCLGDTLKWTVDWYKSESEGKSATDLTLEQIRRYQELGSVNDE